MRSKKKSQERRVAVIDSETDPFKFGEPPKPFMWGFYDGDVYEEFIDDSLLIKMGKFIRKGMSILLTATEKLLDYLMGRKEPLMLYAHNGGKFDFFFFMEYGAIENPALIINGRIVKAGFLGIHEIRDSYAIIPVPLKKMVGSSAGDKLDIDYDRLHSSVRHLHMPEISKYCKRDNLVLYEFVMNFRKLFGDKLTVGAAAIAELEKLHPVSRQNSSHDAEFRKFYYGGRVQCFEAGKIEAPPGKKFKIFDVNSMYPAAMKDYVHPLGGGYVRLKDCIDRFNHRTGEISGFGGIYFMHFIGHNKGAIPRRDDKTHVLGFDHPYGDFYACSHEVKAASELGLIKIEQILDVWIPCSYQDFKAYVDFWGAEKVRCQEAGDEAGTLFAKLMLNAAYGKFGSNASEFKEFYILDGQGDDDEFKKFEEWRDQHPLIKNSKGEVLSRGAEMSHDYGRFEIWQCPAPSERGFFDVAVASSITSAARSILLRAIHSAERPLYCDTDSLTCLELGTGVDIHDSRLGAWKFEGSTDAIYIAGKKMYACKLDQLGKDGKPKQKTASKGAALSYDDIVDLCDGKVVEWRSDAPNFKFSGETKFVARKIRRNV